MDIFTIILLSIGLAMDCFAVSVAKASANAKPLWGGIFFMAVMFGLFQGGMPLIGYCVGYEFIDAIKDYDHWIAMIILTLIGGKMILDDLRGKEEGAEKSKSPYRVATVLFLSVATSIDALATGLVFLGYPESLVKGVTIIGLGSFIFSIIGSLLGNYLGSKFKFRYGLFGGIILIAIGIKIVVEDLGQSAMFF